jgi:NosR/NirI family nitrous oxide reductase transcriptional regulator
MTIPRLKLAAFWLLALLWSGGALAEQRFPPPEFESQYQMPGITVLPPRAAWLEYLDVAVLATTLSLATWLALKQRSRKAIFGLSLFSLLYFGFYRKGCICAIGAPQNVAYALFNSGYTVPLAALAFFLLPLVFALFAGRSFCAAVCPHGALQDLMLIKPVKVPPWLEDALGILPYVYLGAGVLFAATATAFVICRFDPFVPLFRLSGSMTMLLAGGAFLLLAMFVGRPYCRFLCPYGALLKLASVFSKWRVRVTPDFCTQCRLCEHSCPFGALREPSAGAVDARTLATERQRLAWQLLLLPVFIAGVGWIGSNLSTAASKLHPTVALVERYFQHQKHPVQYAPQSPEALELKRAEDNLGELLPRAAATRRQFVLAGWLLGGWVGLVVGIKLISLSLRRTRTDYEPDRGACFSCGRCFEYCPNELVRRGLLPVSALKEYGNACAAGVSTSREFTAVSGSAPRTGE